MDLRTDSEIVGLYWARSEAAIAASAEKYGGYCHTIAYNILHNDADAEECVNDTWLGAWKSIPPQRPDCLRAYLGKITRNFSLNRFKRYHAEKRGFGQVALALSELQDCIPDETDMEQAAEASTLVEAVNRFLYAQPERKRNIFIRRYWYLCPIRQIAAHYGLSESKVTSLLFRMRKELKAQLETEGITL